jgi:CRP-like cAMP-binding protein
VFAGIALNIDQSVGIGDFVQIHKAGDEKVVGQLKEISWRSTHLETLNGEMITFPNSKFSAFTITNFSASRSSEKSISVIIDGRVPALRAIRILQSAALDALTELNGQYEGLPHVGIKTIRNDGVEYQITYQVDFMSQNEASWKIQQAVILHLAKAGLKPAGHKTGDDPVADAGFLAPDETRLASLIKATAIFGNLTAEELGILVRHTRLRTFQADAIVVQAGEAGSDLYLVLEGLLNNGQVRKSNRDSQHVLRPGDLFHAAASLLGNVHKTTVRARTPSLICEIENAGLHELFSQNSETMVKVARNLVEQDASLGIHWDEEKFTALLAQMRHLYPPSMVFSV